jgi:hypothetical protein
MKDPNRWRDPNGGADSEVLALLQNPPAVGPSRTEADQIWATLSAQLDITFAPPAPDGSQLGPGGHGHGPLIGPAAAAAGTGALVGKATLAVVLLATVGSVVGTRVVSSRNRHERAVAPKTAKMEARPSLPFVAPSPIPQEPQAPPPAPTSAPAMAQPEVRPRPERSVRPRAASNTPSPIEPSIAPPPPMVVETPPPAPAAYVAPQAAAPAEKAPISVNELLEEGRRLDRARIALRAHDPEQALRLLGEGTVRTTELAQEREALTIEAMASNPALRAKATERARFFMQAYPNSPYRARIKAIIFERE